MNRYVRSSQMGILNLVSAMSLRKIRLFLLVSTVMLFGCGLLNSGDPEHFVRMNGQFVPELQASDLWGYKISCDYYKSGDYVRDPSICLRFEREMARYQKNCEDYKSGRRKSSDVCEALVIYEEKYKNKPVPSYTRPVKPQN